MRALLVPALLLLAGCAVPTPPERGTSTTGPGPAPDSNCGHAHATFALYKPGPDGRATRVDFAAPRTESGDPYYDIGSARSGGDPRMTKAIHMHQVGPEAGSPEVAQSQLHMEEEGTCVTVREALAAVEVDVMGSRMILTGGHVQVAGQAGTFTATRAAPFRAWLQWSPACGAWTWDAMEWEPFLDRTLQDGEAFIVSLGEPDAGAMEELPPPVTRPAVDRGCAEESGESTMTGRGD